MESGKQIQRALFLTNMTWSHEKSLGLQISGRPEDQTSLLEKIATEELNLVKMNLNQKNFASFLQVTPPPPSNPSQFLNCLGSLGLSPLSWCGLNLCYSPGRDWGAAGTLQEIQPDAVQGRTQQIPHQGNGPFSSSPRPYATWDCHCWGLGIITSIIITTITITIISDATWWFTLVRNCKFEKTLAHSFWGYVLWDVVLFFERFCSFHVFSTKVLCQVAKPDSGLKHLFRLRALPGVGR